MTRDSAGPAIPFRNTRYELVLQGFAVKMTIRASHGSDTAEISRNPFFTVQVYVPDGSPAQTSERSASVRSVVASSSNGWETRAPANPSGASEPNRAARAWH